MNKEDVMEKKGRSAKTVGVFKKAVKSVGIKAKVSPEEFYRRVAHKAYELYISRGADHGNDQADWLEAERLIRAELAN
jgi:hypothetical protein